MSKRNLAIIKEQPKATTELRREGRLARIAKALASGATVTDIAEAEGIGRTLASREANSPECRQLIAEFVSNEQDEMRAMFYRALRVIAGAEAAGEGRKGGTLQELEELVKSGKEKNGLEADSPLTRMTAGDDQWEQ